MLNTAQDELWHTIWTSINLSFLSFARSSSIQIYQHFCTVWPIWIPLRRTYCQLRRIRTFLQRMEELHSSKNLRNQLSPSGMALSQKLLWSPLFYEPLGRMLMSRLLNPKKRWHSTCTSPKSWLSSHCLTRQGEPENQRKWQWTQSNLVNQEMPIMELNSMSQKRQRIWVRRWQRIIIKKASPWWIWYAMVFLIRWTNHCI